jgi:hypothetical protein
MNNPLNLTDPSGYFSLRGFLSNPFASFNNHGDRVGGAILGLPFGSRGYHAVFNFLQGSGGYQLKSAVLTAASGFCYAWAAACNAGAQAGLARAYGASDGDALRAGAIAGVSTGAFQLAGTVGGGSYWAHAAAGCVSTAAGGGNCGRGAVSAVFGKYATKNLQGFGGDGLQGDIALGVATIVAGGVGSVIGGGKFENGAKTAAYGYLFNFLASERRVRTYNPNTEEITVDKRYVVSFSASGENNGDLGLIEEYANKGLRGIAKRTFNFIDLIAPEGYGTQDVDGLAAKREAYTLDVPLRKIYSNLGLSTDLGGITATDMVRFLDTAASSVPRFTPTFGTTQQILQRIEEKYDGKK